MPFFDAYPGTVTFALSTPSGAPSHVTSIEPSLAVNAKYTVTGSNYVKGTYTFKFTFKKDGKEVCAQVVFVFFEES